MRQRDSATGRQSAINATAEMLVRRRRLFLRSESLLLNSVAIHGSWFSRVCTHSEEKLNLTIELFDFITQLQIGLRQRFILQRSLHDLGWFRKVVVNHRGRCELLLEFSASLAIFA